MNTRGIVLWLASIGFVTFLAAGFGAWYMKPYLPESFEHSVELLKNNPNVMRKIGTYSSHSWKHTGLPGENDNPAILRVSFKGSAAEIYLTCTVSRNAKGAWRVERIIQDSLKRF